jgi:uncharacterized protein
MSRKILSTSLLLLLAVWAVKAEPAMWAKAGYEPQAGIDRKLKAQAEAEGDKIRGFETVAAQVRMFADLPQAAQIAFLVEVLDDLEECLELLDKLAKAWIDGDTETIARIGVDEMRREAPVVYKKLLVDRNVAWGLRRAADPSRRRALGRP